jgi:hypothetical protein
MKIEDINDKKRILSNEEIESINSIQIIRPEGKELTFEEKCKINKYIQFMLNEEKNRSEVKIKKVKVLFGFSFGYAGIKDIKEIIVIDDASTDYTDRICRAFNGKITYIDRDKRGGASVCRNIGNELATGDIIAVCDADYYLPERGDAIAKFFSKYKSKSIFYSGLYLKDARSGNMVEQGAYEWDFKSKSNRKR